MTEPKPRFTPEELPYRNRTYQELLDLVPKLQNIHAQNVLTAKGSERLTDISPNYIPYEWKKIHTLDLPTLGSNGMSLFCLRSDSYHNSSRPSDPLIRLAVTLFKDGAHFVAEGDNVGLDGPDFDSAIYDIQFGAEMNPAIIQVQIVDEVNFYNPGLPLAELEVLLADKKRDLSDDECFSIVELLRNSTDEILDDVE